MHGTSRILMLLAIGYWLLASSCDRNRVFETNVDIPDYVWNVKNKPVFEVNIEDTASLYNLFVNVRNASHYQYANLYVFATITFPNGKIRKDTVECMLADASGQWKGDGMGDIWDNQILWMPKVKFPLAGKYKFEYEQAMRTEQLQFIMEVGLRVEKAVKK
ncbi:MAG TPA: gliding motility lipoprotein GldH [Bacteroidia bacterium]